MAGGPGVARMRRLDASRICSGTKMRPLFGRTSHIIAFLVVVYRAWKHGQALGEQSFEHLDGQ